MTILNLINVIIKNMRKDLLQRKNIYDLHNFKTFINSTKYQQIIDLWNNQFENFKRFYYKVIENAEICSLINNWSLS